VIEHGNPSISACVYVDRNWKLELKGSEDHPNPTNIVFILAKVNSVDTSSLFETTGNIYSTIILMSSLLQVNYPFPAKGSISLEYLAEISNPRPSQNLIWELDLSMERLQHGKTSGYVLSKLFPCKSTKDFASLFWKRFKVPQEKLQLIYGFMWLSIMQNATYFASRRGTQISPFCNANTGS